ncbi:Os12g0256700 [Oryza sativa Japonica Group]|jgi:hypothetical protein|uniref:Os12g0256700 protein n=1 Tax=Oryza sativa subsp. japonica TaxID=39947 RepID=A0A0P0Y8N4_ORYSJ|nr:Os12g0256700 [Oryza sativa Japonica Group]
MARSMRGWSMARLSRVESRMPSDCAYPIPPPPPLFLKRPPPCRSLKRPPSRALGGLLLAEREQVWRWWRRAAVTASGSRRSRSDLPLGSSSLQTGSESGDGSSARRWRRMAVAAHSGGGSWRWRLEAAASGAGGARRLRRTLHGQGFSIGIREFGSGV